MTIVSTLIFLFFFYFINMPRHAGRRRRRRGRYWRRRYRRRPSYRPSATGSSRTSTDTRGFPGAAHMRVMQMPPIMPATIQVPLTFSYKVAKSATNPSAWSTIVYINDIYDPSGETGNHQPRGHDQWNGFYQHYQVNAAKIEVRIFNLSGASKITLVPQTYNTSPATLDEAEEHPLAKSVMIETGGTGYMTSYVNCDALLGMSEDSINYQAAFGSSPSRRHFWTIGGVALVAAASSSVVVDYRVTYYCRMFDRKQLAKS